ncbi:hydroxyisourate hydrolase [Corynebacterium heidelbergense]|uniref:5-hydroxyisourate hydrolase n=1 Tax=Corynebacterium heidelbergense TaxID=2055947 RepID=A0A364VEI8_9CORY|nr:hydroxyisourate hydrolase [Corynebacterium heidelbergense]RAV35024.1 hydroxyisourate hydrolase [Corynebacterium heidelbergense]WCZ37428.1 5-hydroxyisourate hydrolase precursor [Corynebacterium heidelbergense]
MKLTTHALNTATGQPAADLGFTLTIVASDSPADGGPVQAHSSDIAEDGRTDEDGRYAFDTTLAQGTYRLRFHTGAYFAGSSTETIYPHVDITFTVHSGQGDHLHVPLLISPFGYTTYRGS